MALTGEKFDGDNYDLGGRSHRAGAAARGRD